MQEKRMPWSQMRNQYVRITFIRHLTWGEVMETALILFLIAVAAFVVIGAVDWQKLLH